jgi:nucleotide-binding universal stress UspA family protein
MSASVRPRTGRGPAAAAGGESRPAAEPTGRVIVGIDDSPSGLAALRWALLRARNTGAQLVAVRSWALGLPRHGGRRPRRLARPRVVLYFGGSEQRDASAKLVRSAFRIVNGGPPGDVDVTVRTPEGDPGAALTGAARPGDLIVVGGEHVPRWRRRPGGWVSRYCFRHASCPVVVVAPGQDRRPDARPPG